MDTFSLYDDLPLFSGDLLVGWSPLTDELPALVQDELQQDDNQLFISQTTTNKKQMVKGNLTELPKKEEKTTFPSVCLDTNVNLLTLLENGSSSPQQAVSPLHFELDNSMELSKQPSADDMLKMSELLLANLTAAQVLGDEESPAVHDNCLDLSSLQNLTGESSMLSDDEVDSILSGNNNEVDTLLSNSSDILSGDILSPVSPKDVEDILSMNASSPYSITASSPCSSTNFSNSYPTSPYSLDSFQSENSAPAPESSEEASTISMKYLREELLKPAPKTKMSEDPVHTAEISRQKSSRRHRVKYEPYSPPPIGRSQKSGSHTRQTEAKCADNRSQRKKQQNKDAALRYRQKKREEKSTIKDECGQLEQKNNELKDKVDSMTREIQYLKDLLAEVYKAKGIAGSK